MTYVFPTPVGVFLKARLDTLELLDRAFLQQQQQEAQAEENARLRAMVETKQTLEVQTETQTQGIDNNVTHYNTRLSPSPQVISQQPIKRSIDFDKVTSDLLGFFDDNGITELRDCLKMVVNNEVPYINVTVK
jgi:hypothetical protein